MLKRVCGVLVFFVTVVSAAALAEPDKKTAAPPAAPAPGPQRLTVALAPAAPADPVPRYPLLPLPADRTPGNGALLWVQAGVVALSLQREVKPGEFQWFFDPKPGEEQALPDFQARNLLARFAGALRLADQAARCERCEWERPPLTVQNLGELIPILETQYSRLVARLLNLRCRMELHDRAFDKAAYTLQTGLAMARRLGAGGTVMEHLVGFAFLSVYAERIEEWMQTPGSPDLFWSLAALPSPFFDLHATLAHELSTLYRSYPALRRLGPRAGRARLTNDEATQLGIDLVANLVAVEGRAGRPGLSNRVAVALVALPPDEAKKYLRGRGWTEAEVNAASLETLGLSYFCEQYDEVCADILNWSAVPPWQGHAAFIQAATRAADLARANRNPLCHLVPPPLARVYESALRTERKIATLRVAEALRRYAAAHGGRAPDRLADITADPLPIDPETGKGFDDLYAVRDGKAVLEVRPKFWVWRYELPATR